MLCQSVKPKKQEGFKMGVHFIESEGLNTYRTEHLSRDLKMAVYR